MMSNPTEQVTRQELIDRALIKAGWDLADSNQVGQEIPVDRFDPAAWAILRERLKREGWDGSTPLPSGISDYLLYRSNGQVLAVVEAKRTSVNPRIAKLQAEFYASEIEKWPNQSFQPFVFLTNGHKILFWEKGFAHEREVHGFFSRADLENRLDLRKNQTPLTQMAINTKITNRAYQIEAVRRVCEAYEQGKRRTLLVMATGTGKTRTAMAIVDVFIQAHQARRVLFVADRDELVDQAIKEGFAEHLPDEPHIRITSANVAISTTNRLFAVTIHTLSNCFQAFTPGFFDLIIFDEVHRSIFNKWNELLTYFDARLLGLTATPADFIDRNTFVEFGCPDNIPTSLYPYEKAIQEGYLVDSLPPYAARTRFQRDGIKGRLLSEREREDLRDAGHEPDDMEFTGADLERKITNRDTLRQQWLEIWDVCLKDASGHLPGKTIVFAMNQDHAERLLTTFNEVFPQYHELAELITSESDFKRMGITKFKKESYPRIAISVDMLDTGVNVPEVVNLIFMRPIHSRIKLWQMIGRATRADDTCKQRDWLPLNDLGQPEKREFLIIDFWQNQFNKDPNEQPPTSTSVMVRIFQARLKLLEHYLPNQQSDDCRDVVRQLRTQIATIPIDSISVKATYLKFTQVWNDAFWYYLVSDKVRLLREQIAPLLRFAPAGDPDAAAFINKLENLKLQLATGQNTAATIEAIVNDVARMPDFVPQDATLRPAWELGQAPQRLEHATFADLNDLADKLGGWMKKRTQRSSIIQVDLADRITERGYIFITGRQEALHVEEYRRLVEERVTQLVTQHPTLQKVRRGEAVSDLELVDLERTLYRELGRGDLQLTTTNIKKAFDNLQVDSLIAFLRTLLDLRGLPTYQEIVSRQFIDYLGQHPFTADQVLFLRTVESEFSRKKSFKASDLYKSPLTQFGNNAVDRLFQPKEINDMLAFLKQLSVTD